MSAGLPLFLASSMSWLAALPSWVFGSAGMGRGEATQSVAQSMLVTGAECACEWLLDAEVGMGKIGVCSSAGTGLWSASPSASPSAVVSGSGVDSAEMGHWEATRSEAMSVLATDAGCA